MRRYHAIIFVFFLALVAVIIIMVRSDQPAKQACEQEGRFYWRGHCLPSECSVVHP